jgi:hypothetical protein
MRDIYSVKLRNVTPAAVNKGILRASYFPYERFYIFHKEDLESGLVDRMFYVYLLHYLNNTTLQEKIKNNIDVFKVITIKPKLPNNTVLIKTNTDVKSRVNWHIKDFDQHVLVIPTYSRKAQPKASEQKEESNMGYVKSKNYTGLIEEELGAIPDLIVNKENLHQPCFFCDSYLDGFQAGNCRFGNVNCRRHCHIFLPEKRLEINLGEEDV